MIAYGAIEVRAAAELRRLSTGSLEGYAAVFDRESKDLGGFFETIRPGAFTRTLKKPDNVLALYDHDQKSILGRHGANTLRLAQDTRGLHFEIDLPLTQTGRDLATLVERGDVAGASFAFTTPAGGDRWQERNKGPLRELLDVDLHEITVTANPAYPDTEVAKRSRPLYRPLRVRQAMRFLETV